MLVFRVPAISNGTRQYTWSGEEEDQRQRKTKQIIIAAKIVDKLILWTTQVKLSLACVLEIRKRERLKGTILVSIPMLHFLLWKVQVKQLSQHKVNGRKEGRSRTCATPLLSFHRKAETWHVVHSPFPCSGTCREEEETTYCWLMICLYYWGQKKSLRQIKRSDKHYSQDQWLQLIGKFGLFTPSLWRKIRDKNAFLVLPTSSFLFGFYPLNFLSHFSLSSLKFVKATV